MKRVLIVDDQSLVRNVLRLILEQQGYECLEAENGQQAWDWLFEPLAIDLIVTDNHMPIMSGWQLITKIKSINNLHHLPLILISGTLTEELKARARGVGVDAILSKPLNVRELLNVVSRLVFPEHQRLNNEQSTHPAMSPHYAGR